MRKLVVGLVSAVIIAAPVANAATASAYPRHPRLGGACQSYDKDFYGWANYTEYSLKSSNYYNCYYNAHQRIGPFNYYWTEKVEKYSV